MEKRATDGGTLQMRADYKNDGFGNRIQKAVDQDGNGSVDLTERYAYDGWPGASGGRQPTDGAFTNNENWDIWADLNGSSALTTRYMRGDAVDQVFARLAWDSDPDPYWLVQDHLGSVREVLDDGGTLVDAIHYDGYGVIRSETAPAYRGRYAWTGRELDVETGLQHNRARYYDSEIGRWISQDPLGFDAGDSNLYRYVRNRPTYERDPSGLDGITVHRNHVLWTIEYPRAWYQFDAVDHSHIPIGTISGATVTIYNQFGGGTVTRSALEQFAESFWNEYGYIHNRSRGTQETILREALKRVVSGGTITTPSPTQQIVKAADDGSRDGFFIVGDALTGGSIPALKAEADRLIAENGGLYRWSRTAGVVGREALLNATFMKVFAVAGKAVDGVSWLKSAAEHATPVFTAIQTNSVFQGLVGAVEGWWNNDVPAAVENSATAVFNAIGLRDGLAQSQRILGKVGAWINARIPIRVPQFAGIPRGWRANNQAGIARMDGAPAGGAGAPRWASNPHLAGRTPIPGTRVTGVRRARLLEVELVRRTGRGTLDWTPAEIAHIQQTGELPPGIVGHHINDVNTWQEWQGDPRNIRLVRGQPANLDEHGGNFHNPTTGPLIDRQGMIDEATGGS